MATIDLITEGAFEELGNQEWETFQIIIKKCTVKGWETPELDCLKGGFIEYLDEILFLAAGKLENIPEIKKLRKQLPRNIYIKVLMDYQKGKPKISREEKIAYLKNRGWEYACKVLKKKKIAS